MAFDPDKYLAKRGITVTPKPQTALDPRMEALKAVPGFLEGVGRTARRSTIQPAFKALGALGVPGMNEAVEYMKESDQKPIGGAGKAGEVVGDVALMSAFPLGKMGLVGRSVASGAQGAAQHQAQNYGKNGKIDLGDAATETAVSSAIPIAGKGILSAFPKWFGKKSLEMITSAPVKVEGGLNPPTEAAYEQALKLGLIPKNKVGRKAFAEAEKRGIGVQVGRDAEQSDLLRKAGVRSNIRGGVLPAARQDIASRTTGSKGLLPDDMQKTLDEIDNLDLAATATGKMDKGGWMDGPDARDFRKMVDQTTKPQTEKVSNAKAQASRAVRRATELDLATRMGGRPGETTYMGNKQAMAELAPVISAFGDKGNKNYSFAPELISLGAGAVGGIGAGVATGSPEAAFGSGLLPLALVASRRYPGMAQISYNLGKNMGSKKATRAGRDALNLARSGFMPEDE